MTARTIAVFNFNETTRDPRVLRMAGALAEQGHRVCVFGLVHESRKAHEKVGQVELIRLPRQQSFTRREMQALCDACPDAGRIMDSCDPWVMDAPGLGSIRWFLRRAPRAIRRSARRAIGLPPERPYMQRRPDPIRDLASIRVPLLTNVRLFQAAAAIRPDVAYCNDLETLVAGFMLKSQFNIPLIYDAHEIYAEQFAPEQRSATWHDFHVRLERALLPCTDIRLTVCDSLGDYFVREYGSGPFQTIHNVPSISLSPPESVLARRNQPRRMIYHGAFTEHRGLEQMIEAARLAPRAEFIFRGFGPLENALRRQARDPGVRDRIRFADPVEVDELVSSASACDIGINPFISVCKNTEYALPNKLFEYMMAGLAVVSSDLPELRAITRELEIGSLYDARNPKQLAQAINDLLDDPARLDQCRQNAWQAAQRRYHWEHERQRFLAACEPVLR